MIEHETRVKVNMSFYINIGTESHPEDIDEETMKQMVIDNVEDYLYQIRGDRECLENIVDDYEFEDIKAITDEEEHESEFVVEVARTSTRFASVVVKAGDEEEAKKTAMQMVGDIEFPHESDAEYEAQQVVPYCR